MESFINDMAQHTRIAASGAGTLLGYAYKGPSDAQGSGIESTWLVICALTRLAGVVDMINHGRMVGRSGRFRLDGV